MDGNGSTFVIETGLNGGVVKFLKNSSQSFMYSLLGPFPWQFRYRRQMIGLFETIPWYIFIIIYLVVSINFIRKKGISNFLKFYRLSLPLLLFGILTIGALSMFINNYGVISRVRIPALICLFALMSLGYSNFYEKIYEKIFTIGRSWVHWFTSVRKTF